MKHLAKFGAILCAVTLFYTQSLYAQEKVVATVNGYPIMESQVKQALNNKANTSNNRKIAIEQAIDDFLVQKAIDESGLKINYAQVDNWIEVIAAENGLTFGQLLDVLDYQGITYENYRQQIAHRMLMEEVKNISIGKSIQIKPQDVKALTQKMLEKGNIKKVIEPEYKISHILLKTTPILNDNQAKTKLNQFISDINSGKTTFEALAQEYSVDYLSAADGGNLGWNFLDTYDPAFAKTAKNTKQDKISAPFKSQFGWHILKVTAVRNSDRTESAYEKKAYEQLANKQAQEIAKNWIQTLRKEADIKYIDN